MYITTQSPAMSYTEINHEKGMRHGGMPYDVLLDKLEETDPELVDEVTGADEFRDIEDDYKDATRAEIIDWTPDAPMLESDHARRDPAWSRSSLNLRYNGTRGSHPELPAHPELFIGFTGDDPRGANNDPRFDQVRGQMTSRAANLEVRMGNNDDNAIAERPWTAQSISYGKKELHRRVQGSAKIFTAQKEGRAQGRNTVVDSLVFGAHRRDQKTHGGEGFENGDARFFAGDHGSAVGSETDGVRGLDRPNADRAPWRNALHDADLAVMQYGQSRGGGETKTKVTGGALGAVTVTDADHGASTVAAAARRATLGATLANAAKFGAAMRSAQADGDLGASSETTALGKAALQRDVAAIYRNAATDTDLGASTVGAAVGRGLVPVRALNAAITATQTSHLAANPALANIGAIVRGLREGTASARRKIADQVVASGARVGFDHAASISHGAAKPGQVTSAMYNTSATASIAAANGLTVFQYKSVTPVENGKLRHTGHTGAQFGAQQSTGVAGKQAAQSILNNIANTTHGDGAIGRADETPYTAGNVGHAPVHRYHGAVGEEMDMLDENGMGEF